MLKAICKNVAWMAVPLSLALGCAANRPQAETSYGPVETLTPTSGEPEQRIYSSVDPGTISAGAPDSVHAQPAGANPANWGVAEEIREKIMEDHSLARVGDSLIAEVASDGMVTLRGSVSSSSEKERVRDGIAKLPGVKGIEDQLTVGEFDGNGTVDMR